MHPLNWHRQTKDEPLFPDLLWSRPENKRARGKLLIIGGNLHGLAAPAKAYEEANKASAGYTRILLPESVHKQINDSSIPAVFAPATPSGSFAISALGQLLEEAEWADGVLFAGDLSRNSETAILLEKFLKKYRRQVTLVHDAADYITNTPQIVHNRPNTALVITIAQLQRLFKLTHQTIAITMSIQLPQLVEVLESFQTQWEVNIITKLREQIVVVAEGKTCVTDTELDNEDYWRVPVAAHAAVWWLQNPNKTLEALSCSLIA